MKPTFDSEIKEILNTKLLNLEENFDADILMYHGAFDGDENTFLQIVEDLAEDKDKRDTLCIVLTTPGGSAGVVERYVNIVRNHYKEVNFVVPDYAYSAGTIFCMSGDNIYMDYFSVLGPIDPQVQNKEGKLVAALGYLDKINELLEKADRNKLTQAEFIILKDFDLAELRGYEQARDLTIDLLKQWLIKYKFKNWDKHRTNPDLKGRAVTKNEKIKRAKKIADDLSDNNKWKSHGRPINIEALRELRLEIEDYSKNPERRKLIRDYYDSMSHYIGSNNIGKFVHTRKFI